MKRVKLFEEYFQDKLTKGQFKVYVGSSDNVKRLMRNLSSESKEFVQQMSDTQVRVLDGADTDSAFEIEDLLGIFGLTGVDLNSF